MIHSIFRDADISNESRLIQYLLAKYEKVGTFARPVRDSARPVNVGFMMTLVQILDFDETKQLIISNVWKSYVSLHVLLLLYWVPSCCFLTLL